MKKVLLSQDKYALVDDEDFEKVKLFKWTYHNQGYACRVKTVNRKQTMFFMHRFIMNAKKGQSVDHKNHDRLDNRKENLRTCTQSQNLQNMKVRSGRILPKGVTSYPTKKGNKYRAQIFLKGKYIHMGVYFDLKEATKAYNKGARQHFGEFALLNKI
jgi:hypothetical protein